MAEQLRVMISSTAADLPEHRKQVVEACLRQGMFPLRMEDLPATSDAAAAASVKLVDDADVFIGVIAHRYGYIPKAKNPDQISVTEMEYNRAVERKIERLIFIIDRDRPLGDFTIKDIDLGESAEKLSLFKNRLETENIVNFFKSPDDLRANAIDGMSRLRQSDLAAFHYVSDIPAPPEKFIAHPYTLLQTHNLIGRVRELRLLTDWITAKELEFDGQSAPARSVGVMGVVAMGGMGKSALTWKWFNEVAPQEMNLAGRMWWSFYESDATFENFVIRALAYVTRQGIEEVRPVPAPERETRLLAALDHQPFLFVLDGLERVLIAYARMDAARLDDSEVGKEKNLRKTADPRIGSFLRRLTQVTQSRILVSSRLHPAELETIGGDPIPGSFRLNLEGLTDEDAVDLWRAFGVTGSRDELLPVFNTFAKHPLLIQSLAGEVKRYRRAPGDFQKWNEANPKFHPSKFSEIKDVMSHVLEFALRGLNERGRRVAQTIAAFRMPTTYDTLAAILIGENKPCANEPELDAALTDLEDRGLVGWDKRANRYDLHPIVRGVVWSGLGNKARRGVYTNLHAHFEAVPRIDELKVNSFDDLTPAVELYSTLIGLGRYDDAYEVFRDRLGKATHFRLSAARQQSELVEMLFPGGPEQARSLKPYYRAAALHWLAMGYLFSGQLRRAATLFRLSITTSWEIGDENGLDVSWYSLSNTLRLSGVLREAEACARLALVITRERNATFREASCLNILGLILAARGISDESVSAQNRAFRMFVAGLHKQYEGVISSFLAQSSLWLRRFVDAKSRAQRGWDLAQEFGFESDFIRAARVQGEVALAFGDFVTANERLHHALIRVRRVNYLEEELPVLVALAELLRQQNDMKGARQYLDDVWELADRGPYRVFHADAFNVLAQVERDEGNSLVAIEAATKAYQLAWCDGPPFAYHWGLEKAKQHLKELGAPEPLMPAFDESKFEPMPEVEINPRDEFYVDEESVS